MIVKKAPVALSQKWRVTINAARLLVRRMILCEGDVLRCAIDIRAAETVVRVIFSHGLTMDRVDPQPEVARCPVHTRLLGLALHQAGADPVRINAKLQIPIALLGEIKELFKGSGARVAAWAITINWIAMLIFSSDLRISKLAVTRRNACETFSWFTFRQASISLPTTAEQCR